MRYISGLPDAEWRNTWPRTLAVLGSTGSIGRSALEVIRLQPDRFRIAALAGGRNVFLLAKQATEFRPEYLGVPNAGLIPQLRALLPSGYAPEILTGQKGYEAIASLSGVSMVLSAQVGAAGLRGTIAAARTGKVIALANKESLVLAGRLIRECCAQSGACILPVDSEHNAIFQCLAGHLLKSESSAPDARAERSGVLRLILTASGGPFYGRKREHMSGVTSDQALAHPNWSMGAKITIDSATLMNKGLELIEAHHLYGLPMSALDVVVHRESIIHSLVEYADGSQLAQLSLPDMRTPIANCLGFPELISAGVSRLDLFKSGSLTFSKPDEDAFPCLTLARQAQERGLGSPVVLNAANEEAVAAFLENRIGFLSIADTGEQALADYASGRFTGHDASRAPAGLD